jgi:hypothetical protein
MNEDVLDTVRAGLADVRMDTPVEAIVAAGRARRRRRVSAVTAAGVAVATGLALGVPALNHNGTAPPSGGVQLAAFSLVSNPNGTATLTLTKGATLNPATLGSALAGAGVPAIVRVGTFCDSPRKTPGLDQVMSSDKDSDGKVVITFTPSAMPAGAELSIGYKPESSPGTKDRVQFTLVPTAGPLNCTSFR